MHERLRFESEIDLLAGTMYPVVAEFESPAVAEKCKREWEKFLGSLPKQVTEALGTGDSSNAATIAIHNGIRDLATLVRMVFHSKYGKDRGYCKFANTPQDAKFKQLWEGETKLIRGLLARPSPPLAQKGGIVCRKVERKLADPAPDKPKVDITGRYENRYTSAGRPFTDWTISINQAGRHIEGILTKTIYPDPRPRGWLFRQADSPMDRAFTAIHGDLQSDGSFLFFDKSNPAGNWGYFRYENGKLSWELAGKGKSYPHLIEKRPTILNTEPFDKLVWEYEKFPLTVKQVRTLESGFAISKLGPRLEKYFKTEAGIKYSDKSKMSSRATEVAVYIADVMTGEFGVHERDLELGRFYAKSILAANKWKFKQITRSALDWIQIMYDINTLNGFGLPAIEKYLGLKRSKDTQGADSPQHKYKVTLKLTGGAVIIGGYKGTVTFEKVSGKRWGPETYDIHFFGGGLDVSPRDTIEGKAETYHEWLPPDIPGKSRLGELGISFGPSAAAGFMHVFGSGYLPPMDVVYTDASIKLKKLKPPKAGGKALPFGKIWNKKFPDYDATTAVVKTDYGADYKLGEDVHFCLGSSLLTDDARQALRIVCANELMAFSSSTSVLEVTGHTDRVDTPDRNLTLSLLRAENTVQAIRDILGSKFAIPDSNIKSSGKGENLAIKDGRPDNVPDPRYRRVDVYLNTRLVISLKAL
jgi:outer membrane protein OmpA-like peptidoglycan-associated protein